MVQQRHHVVRHVRVREQALRRAQASPSGVRRHEAFLAGHDGAAGAAVVERDDVVPAAREVLGEAQAETRLGAAVALHQHEHIVLGARARRLLERRAASAGAVAVGGDGEDGAVGVGEGGVDAHHPRGVWFLRVGLGVGGETGGPAAAFEGIRIFHIVAGRGVGW